MSAPNSNTRHSIRLKEWNYADAAWYFITVVTHRRQFLFGNVTGDTMALNDIGKIACEEWERIPNLRPEIALDEYIIMPNHLHGIVVINESGSASASDPQEDRGSAERAHSRAPLREASPLPIRTSRSLG